MPPRFLLDDKMLRAEKKREEFIEGIRRKAHEEDAKLKEIAFINELQVREREEKAEWKYRVTHLLANLGWVDLDFDCYTVCPILLRLVGIWQKWLSSWARW